MKATDAVWLVALGVGGYLLYQLLSKVPQLAQQATAPISDAIAAAWVGATNALNGSVTMQLLGSIAFPDGSLVPIAQLPAGAMRSDASGNLQILYGGHIWQLSPHNANGDFPASLLR
ncbi:MAG: hypothetical protein ACRDLF_14930 [Solirubrobacteraceae bacterium]